MLPLYKTIVVATDLSPNSAHAFRHAVLLARQSQAQLHLLHIVPEIDSGVRTYVSTLMGEGRLDEFEQSAEENARETIRQRLRAFADAELADHPDDLQRIAAIEVHHGHAVAEILKYGDRVQADVIVLGTHGKGALEYTFLGSVSEKILRKTKRPVFIVPLPH
jgi:nucleotide-binding universal stress UspA family protein